MVFPLYFAMTAGEIRLCGDLPPLIAWMACHFSPYSVNLSNCPAALPEGSMLIIDDSSPIENHDIEQITHQLTKLIKQLKIASVLLDFQRPENPNTQALAQKLTAALPCPVGVSECYAKNLDCPVFLSPPPIHIPLSKYITPWSGREIWLETALSRECVTVTTEGTVGGDWVQSDNPVHFSQELSCHYQILPGKNEVRFLLQRTREDLNAFLRNAESLGITKAVGLYQELG